MKRVGLWAAMVAFCRDERGEALIPGTGGGAAPAPAPVAPADAIAAAVSAGMAKAVDQLATLVDAKLEAAGVRKTAGNAGPMGGGQAPAIHQGTKSARTAAALVEATDLHKGKGLSFARVLRAIAHAKLEGSEVEMALHRYGYQKEADEVAAHRKALGTDGLASGGALTPDAYVADLIGLLYAATVVRKMGAQSLPMGASVTFPKLAGGATASWIGENQALGVSGQTFGQIRMMLKKLGIMVPVSNDVIRHAAIAAEGVIRNDLLNAYRLAEDAAYIRGNGSEYSPRGIRYRMAAANVLTTSGATVANMVTDLYAALGAVEDSDVPMVGCGWIMVPRTRRALMQARESGLYLFKEEMERGQLLGHPVATTTAIPKNLGGGTETEIYFGCFQQLLIGDGLTAEIKAVDGAAYEEGGVAKSGLSRDQTVIRLVAEHDCALRYDQAFSVVTAVTY